MNAKKNNWLKTLAAVLTLGVVGAPELASQVEDDDEEVYELSPFTIEEGADVGYQATSTLAGTRINTQMRDVGAAISIITEEFFEDTGATDASTVLSYALNIEVSGEQGNFAGGDNATAERSNPQRNGQRVRGLAQADLTRGFFLTDIPFDNYNTNRVTINRGPNSLLFGIGGIGGVINNNVKAASLGGNFGEVQVRVGERSSHRKVLDINRVLIEDHLAIRLIGLHDENQFQQRPAFEVDERLHLAFEAVLSKNENSDFLGRTILRGNIEDGSIHGTPSNIIPPGDGISGWFKSPPNVREQEEMSGKTFPDWVDDGSFVPKYTVDPRPGIPQGNGPGGHGLPMFIFPPWFVQLPVIYNSPTAQVASVGIPGDPTVAGVDGRILWRAADHGRARFDIIATVAPEFRGAFPGFIRPVIMNRNVLDYENLLITGNLGQVEQDFDVQNFAFEQTFLNGKAGIELVYDSQRYENSTFLPYDSAGSDVYVDVSEYHANDLPNPNLGKAFIDTTGTPSTDEKKEREAFRATVFFELDFRDKDNWLSHLGRHVFTGFHNDQTIDTKTRNFINSWTDASPATDVRTILWHGINAGRSFVPTVNYLTDSLLDPSIKSFEDVRLNQYITTPRPMHGETYLQSYNHLGDGGARVNPNPRTPGDPMFYDEFKVHNTLTTGTRDQQNIESKAFSWQSFLFGENLVGLVGWRKDETVDFERVGLNRISSGPLSGELDEAASLILGPEPAARAEGDTITKSLVAHFPEDLLFQLPGDTDLTAHYNESENFSPAGVRRNLFGEILSTPTGTTKEYGFTFELLDRKLAIRVNWFEMSSSFVNAGLNLANLTHNQDRKSDWRKAEIEGISFEDALQQSIDDHPNTNYPFTSYADVYAAMDKVILPKILALTNPRFNPPDSDTLEFDPIVGLSDITSFVAEGFEIDVVGNLTDNWRVSLNVGQQETVQSNTAALTAEVAAQTEQNTRSQGLWDLELAPTHNLSLTQGDNLSSFILIPLAAAKAKDGAVSQEQREWRVNFATNYSFSNDTALKGFALGGAVRYQSKIAVGYPLVFDELGVQTPVVDKPWFGPAQTNGDLWVSYNRPIMDGKYHWKIQLNARNAFGDNSAIPVRIDPDGTTKIIRFPNPREVFLTNTISF